MYLPCWQGMSAGNLSENTLQPVLSSSNGTLCKYLVMPRVAGRGVPREERGMGLAVQHAVQNRSVQSVLSVLRMTWKVGRKGSEWNAKRKEEETMSDGDQIRMGEEGRHAWADADGQTDGCGTECSISSFPSC